MANGHKILITEAEVMAEEYEKRVEGEDPTTGADPEQVIAHNYESISACMARIKELEAEYDELAMKSYRIPQKHHWRGECGHEWRIDQAGECPICERDRLAADCAVLRGTLEFYADPETYFAIGFFPDHPCGEFDEDFEELSGDLGHPDGTPWVKPGKRARQALRDHPGNNLLAGAKAADELAKAMKEQDDD